MESVIEILGGLALVTFMAFFGAIVIWAAWDVIFEIVPSAKGVVCNDISLWGAFKLSWLASFLIKGSSSSSSN